ncbi:hypothetical protein KM043_010487 [Ampulex compressa]|nr:hypothetical protein KM043_010487 [Ampulex compressa]
MPTAELILPPVTSHRDTLTVSDSDTSLENRFETYASVETATSSTKRLDNMEAERMTYFRDKSALYGRELAPGEPPSWP